MQGVTSRLDDIKGLLYQMIALQKTAMVKQSTADMAASVTPPPAKKLKTRPYASSPDFDSQWAQVNQQVNLSNTYKSGN